MIEMLIRKLEKFLQTDIRYLARGSFWLSAAKVVGSITAFLLSIAYARYLPKELYGSYRYILSTLSILGIFALPGMATALTRSVAQGHAKTFYTASKKIFYFSFGITIGGMGIALWHFWHGDTTLALGFLIGALLAPLVETFGSWRGYYDGMKDFKAKTAWNMSGQIFYGLSMLSGICIIYFANFSLTTNIAILIFCYSIGYAIPNIILYRHTIKEIPPGSTSEPSAIKYGYHLSIVSIPSTIANYIDSILLYHYLGPISLAIYSFSIAPVEQIKSFLGTFASAIFPKLSERAKDVKFIHQSKNTLAKKLLRASFFSAVIVGTYILVAPLFFSIFFPRYTESVFFSQILSCSLILFPLGIFGTALKAEGNLKKIYAHDISSPIIQIILIFILVPTYGLGGAIAGRVAGRIINHLLVTALYLIPDR